MGVRCSINAVPLVDGTLHHGDGVAAGIRPCVVSIFVLIVTAPVQMPVVGMAATFAIAAGVALMISLVGQVHSAPTVSSQLACSVSIRARPGVYSPSQGALVIMLYGCAEVALLMGGCISPSLT